METETKRLHHFSKTCWCNGECSKPETKPIHTPALSDYLSQTRWEDITERKRLEIVRAVNSFEKDQELIGRLLGLVKDAVKAMDEEVSIDDGWYKDATRAIAVVEGKE